MRKVRREQRTKRTSGQRTRDGNPHRSIKDGAEADSAVSLGELALRAASATLRTR